MVKSHTSKKGGRWRTKLSFSQARQGKKFIVASCLFLGRKKGGDVALGGEGKKPLCTVFRGECDQRCGEGKKLRRPVVRRLEKGRGRGAPGSPFGAERRPGE